MDNSEKKVPHSLHLEERAANPEAWRYYCEDCSGIPNNTSTWKESADSSNVRFWYNRDLQSVTVSSTAPLGPIEWEEMALIPVDVRDDLIAVVRAWTVEGPEPRFHRHMQKKLLSDWPTLGKAVRALSRRSP